MASRRGLLHPRVAATSNARSLTLLVAILVIGGRIAVATASTAQAIANGGSSWSISERDVLWTVIGVIAAVVASRVNLNVLINARLALVVVALLGLVAVFGSAPVSGARRWIGYGGLAVQPSEIFKLAAIIYLAGLVEARHRHLGDVKILLTSLWPIGVGLIAVALEPDIGTASVVAVVTLATLWYAGLSSKLLWGIGLSAAVVVLGYVSHSKYSYARLTAFLHPRLGLQSINYQKHESLIGLGSGGWTGLGLGHSRVKWGFLPNPHTDFIFTIIGEELGYLGVLTVLAVFIAFLVVLARITSQCRNEVYRLIAFGITIWMGYEALINVMSAIGWWAVTGIPLPFFSYGGTSLVIDLAAMGVMYNIANDTSRTHDISIVAAEAHRPRAPHRVSTYRDAEF